MLPMKFKVCGLTKPEQVQQLIPIGVDFAGFIFYTKSSRYVYNHMTCTDLNNISGIKKIGVFVNASQEEILKTVYDCGINIIQLHGDETPNFCESISNYVSVIKAFRIGSEDNLAYKIKSYEDACDMYLFDTAGAGYGGTGKKFDWQILKEANIQKPYFLSGGIQPEDVEEIRAFAQTTAAKNLFAVDINSGFEVAPGDKDIDKVAAFVNALKTEMPISTGVTSIEE
jgi:phosphoribosylanthranilate isomerase